MTVQDVSVRLPHSGADTLEWSNVHREKSSCRVRGAVRAGQCADAFGRVHPASATQRSLQNMSPPDFSVQIVTTVERCVRR